tara:strand:+ start:611 stop:847 length:237 start_codon:yes stop_codon:yes gene_type:complete
MKIEERVIKIIAEAIEVEGNKIDEDTAIGDFPNWDSMGQLVIITSLEKEFDIKFDPEDIMDLEDVGDMISAIEEYTNA